MGNKISTKLFINKVKKNPNKYGYLYFYADKIDELITENPFLSNDEMLSIINEEWVNLSEECKTENMEEMMELLMQGDLKQYINMENTRIVPNNPPALKTK